MKKANLAKKSLAAILMLAMLLGILAMLPVSAAEPVLATKENPIKIGTVDELNALAATVATATADDDGTYYVEFTADIDFEGDMIDTQSLGNYTVHIDGKGHTVWNYAAKFGIIYNVGDNSTIQNLHAKGVNISCGSTQVGAILGYGRDGLTVKNCTAEGTIVNTSAKTDVQIGVGGIVGAIEELTIEYNPSMATVIMEDCVSNMTLSVPVRENVSVGGMIGKVNATYANVVIRGCINNGAISGGNYAGGMIGRIEYARELTVEECDNNAAVSTTGTAAGGMLGYGNAFGNEENWYFTRNLNFGAISATTYVGGMVGQTNGNTRPYYMNCGNEATVTGTSASGAVGGLHGYANVPKVLELELLFNYSYNIGTIAANGAAASGGCVGYIDAVSGNEVKIQGFCENGTHTFEGDTTNGRHALLVGRVDGCTANLNLKSNHVYESELPRHTETVDILEDSTAKTPAEYLKSRQRSARMRTPDGNGSKNDPYVINTEWELSWFSSKADTLDNVVYVELGADIDYHGSALNITLWNSSRITKTTDAAVSGDFTARELHFNGNGHTISNFTSTDGLFQYVGAGSVIENLNVSSITVSHTATTTSTNSKTGRFGSSSFHAGAIVGTAGGAITMLNCSATNATVTTKASTYAAGGLIGGIGGVDGIDDVAQGVALIVNCHNNGVTVKTNGTAAGGILGTVSTAGSLAITDCTSSGKVSSTSATTGVGGIVGSVAAASDGVEIDNAINTGTIGSAGETAAAGGILGYTVADTAIATSRNEGAVSAKTIAGGIVGQAANVTVKTSANVATVSAYAILGAASGTASVSSSYNEGTAANGLAPATVAAPNCYNGSANRVDAIKSLADTRIDTTATGRQLSIRIKVTDDFGLMGITYLDSVLEGGAKTLSDYDEVGFYFLRSEETVTPDEVLANGKKIVGSAYKGSATRFASAFSGIHPTELDDDLHFVAYAKKGDVEIHSAIRTVDIENIVTDLSDDGCLGPQEVTTDPLEIRLYGGMLRYATAYKQYTAREIKIGNLNIMQDHFDRTYEAYKHPSDALALKNIDRYALEMQALDLDILGLNEVNLYRKNYGGYNVPWEIARRMEIATGEEYYWAFASAVDRVSSQYSNRYTTATGTEGIDYPDGHYRSGDGGNARTFSKVCYGEGIVSKYPIISCTYKDIYADHIGEDWRSHADMVDSDGKTLERRIILVVQLDIDGTNDGKGDIITVMVGHFSSDYVALAQNAAVAAVESLVKDYADTPIFFMGDLNMPRTHAEIEKIDNILNRAGNDNMMTTFRTGSKIDYVYYGQDIEILSYDVASRYHVASDHFPVYVTARVTRKNFD